MTLNVNLGEPYEVFVKSMIKQGYAGSQTEVIRQALRLYQREMQEEEERLVAKAVAHEMDLIKKGKLKTLPLKKIKEEFGL
ncbi:MAG: type II toxin-antitoxin system ParD family antitoxin [Candidatus Bathyarchaeota archaeon]